MAYTATAGGDVARPMTREEKKVIFASSLGTVFEWYDFYLYGSLAAIIAAQFFSGVNPTAAFIFALMAFAAGFAVRPFGALVLRPARRHDRPQVHLPRHHPDHGPVDLHRRHPAQLRHDRHRRADHPDLPAAAAGPGARRRVRRRGDLRRRARAARQARRLHLLDPDHRDARPVPVAARHPRLPASSMSPEDFAAWGWRIPFLVSIVLLGVSVWIRLMLNESPAFQKMKDEGTTSKAPLTESLRPVEEPQDRAARAVRPRRRPGGGLVHRPVLRAVLPDPDAEGRRLQRPT